MATLFIGAAINFAVGLALNALFPPDPIRQEGPRLNNLGFTSAAYGQFVNIIFGTDRVPGNIIDTTDPAIEEVITTETQEVGGDPIFGLGAQEVETTTYTYFLTCRIAFGIEGATDLIRLWGDGKYIYDATGTTQLLREGTSLTFYSGGPNEIQDPEEVSRRGANIPAYRHLTSVKLDRMPLEDFGNRIPNFTAEITYNGAAFSPFLKLDPEPTGFQPPGSPTGLARVPMYFDDSRNLLISLGGGTRAWAANASTLDFTRFLNDTTNGGLAGSVMGYSPSGFFYTKDGFANGTQIFKVDVESGKIVGASGTSTTGTTDSASGYGNLGIISVLRLTTLGGGQRDVVLHLQTAFANSNGSISDGNLFGLSNPIVKVLGTGDGFPAQTWDNPAAIPDHDRNRFFIFCEDTPNNRYQLFRIDFGIEFGGGGAILSQPIITLVRNFTRGSVNDDFNGTSAPQGWAVHRTTGDLILANTSTMVLYNPDTDTILETRQDGNFRGRYNYYNGSLLGYGAGSQTGNGTLRLIDTRTLNLIRNIDPSDVGFQQNPVGSDEEFLEESFLWDDRVAAVFVSREDVGSGATAGNRVLKIFLNRVNGQGVGLDFVVNALSTTYQRQTMAGLEDSDLNVTTLAGDTVFGYTLNNSTTMRDAIAPLRIRYQFDAIQSDWIMKFPKRGGASVLTIPEEDVGILKRGQTLITDPPLVEQRIDDLSLPMSLAVRYKNKDADYQFDIERDKRHLFPNPTMRSKSEKTIDLPIVDDSTNMKQTAQRQLLTTWHERVSYRTVIPWSYIKLDPSDVFNMGVFGETAQLRMSENDLGKAWAIDITGIVEDTKSFASTLVGSGHAGHINQVVPSSLPTRVFFLDAPLLTLADMNFDGVSQAYAAMYGFEPSWPGATLYRSEDDVTYNPSALSNTEAITAKVTVAPSTWSRLDNRFQTAAEGGTMEISAIRRSNEWVSATDETAVLNGANWMLVNTSAGVEVIGFRDVTDNDDGTFTLSHLLRGRLGTEIVSETGPSVGDEVVLVYTSTPTYEEAAIVKNKLILALLDSPFFYKATTVGTMLEDAQEQIFTYTGRDLKPFFPVHIQFIDNGDGTSTVDWERRTRGPFAAELLDGTGITPLNESIEQYDFEVERDSDNVIVASGTVNDQTFADLDETTTNTILFPGGTVGISNGDFETGAQSPWFNISGTFWSVVQLPSNGLTTTDPNFPPGNSWIMQYIRTSGLDGEFIKGQDVDLTSFISDFTDIDNGLVTARFKASIGGMNIRNGYRLSMQYFDGSMVSLGEQFSSSVASGGWHTVTTDNWKRIQASGTIPGGTRTIRVKLRGIRGSGFWPDENENLIFVNSTQSKVAFDNTTLELSDPSQTFTIRVWQVSGEIGRGDPGFGTIPSPSIV